MEFNQNHNKEAQIRDLITWLRIETEICANMHIFLTGYGIRNDDKSP